MQNGQSVFLASLPRSRSLFSVSFQTFDCSRVLEYAKIRIVLQSSLTANFMNNFYVGNACFPYKAQGPEEFPVNK